MHVCIEMYGVTRVLKPISSEEDRIITLTACNLTEV